MRACHTMSHSMRRQPIAPRLQQPRCVRSTHNNSILSVLQQASIQTRQQPFLQSAHRVCCMILKHSPAPGCNSYSPKPMQHIPDPNKQKPTGTCLPKHRIVSSLPLSLCSRNQTSVSRVFFCRASQISSLPRTTSQSKNTALQVNTPTTHTMSNGNFTRGKQP
jgi:hypothetical protein